jgi:hypothetical protein
VQWCRLYGKILRDPKVMYLDPAMRWHFVALLALRCDEERDATDESVSLNLRVSDDEAASIKATLTAAKLIGPGWHVKNWDNLNPPSDHSAERVRRHRAKKRDSNGHGNGHVTPVSRYRNGLGNVTVTVQTREEEKREENTPSLSVLPRTRSGGDGAAERERDTHTAPSTGVWGPEIRTAHDAVATRLGNESIAYRLADWAHHNGVDPAVLLPAADAAMVRGKGSSLEYVRRVAIDYPANGVPEPVRPRAPAIDWSKVDPASFAISPDLEFGDQH